jgi:hypothetical protein
MARAPARWGGGEATLHTSDKTHPLLRRIDAEGRPRGRADDATTRNAAVFRQEDAIPAKQPSTLPTRPPVASPDRRERPGSHSRRRHDNTQLRERSSGRSAAGEATLHSSDKTLPLLRQIDAKGRGRTRGGDTTTRNSASVRRGDPPPAKQPSTLPTRPSRCFARSTRKAGVALETATRQHATPRAFVNAMRDRRSNPPHFRQDPPVASPDRRERPGSHPRWRHNNAQLRERSSTR